uniref:Isoform 3 of Protein sex-lethal n=1 Tax=Drosophila subobscura TaxID=7241 RepID=Q24668-3|nr:sex-lethal [Drosophila subobscura]
MYGNNNPGSNNNNGGYPPYGYNKSSSFHSYGVAGVTACPPSKSRNRFRFRQKRKDTRNS